jgi:hypothetical protein
LFVCFLTAVQFQSSHCNIDLSERLLKPRHVHQLQCNSCEHGRALLSTARDLPIWWMCVAKDLIDVAMVVMQAHMQSLSSSSAATARAPSYAVDVCESSGRGQGFD